MNTKMGTYGKYGQWRLLGNPLSEIQDPLKRTYHLPKSIWPEIREERLRAYWRGHR